jgi:hypothetical protein
MCEFRGRMDAQERLLHKDVRISRAHGCAGAIAAQGCANFAGGRPKNAPGWKPLLRFQHCAIHGEHVFGIAPSMAGRCRERLLLASHVVVRHPSEGWGPVLDFAFVDQRQNWMTSFAVENRLQPSLG